jgi:hypothetical protein
MVKEANTKKKQKKKLKPLHMWLKQNPPVGKLDKAKKEKMYQAFKKRAQARSEHRYIDLGKEPVLLRMYMNGSKTNTTIGSLVKVGSFAIMTSKAPENKGEEIGFTLKLKSYTTGRLTTLVVWRQKHKAYIEV